jgi:phosphatidylglycerophosphatase A
MLGNPLHALALAFGSGLSPVAPGTVGTLWAWLVFLALQPRLGTLHWAALLAAGFVIGCWACTVAARNLGVADPGCIVWDEVIAFWLVLYLLMPASLLAQGIAFALFRFFDAAKPGPVAWADALFKPRHAPDGRLHIGWLQGLGIMLDDLVAALCTLLVIALWRFL